MEKIFQIQKNRLCFEDGESIFLTKEMIQRFSLRQKLSLSIEEYEELLRYRMQLSAYTWLSKKDYFERELEDKLLRTYRHSEWVQELLEKLKQQGYLNDKDIAFQWVATKKYSRRKLEYLLAQKGLSRDCIQEVLNKSYQDPTEEIQRIWEKLGEKEKEKKVMALLRKGYRYSEIKKAISEKE